MLKQTEMITTVNLGYFKNVVFYKLVLIKKGRNTRSKEKAILTALQVAIKSKIIIKAKYKK